MNNERRLLAVLEPFDLTPTQYGVLCCLWQQDGMTTTALAETLKALGGTLTVVLDGIESRKLASRKRDRDDKRVSRVFLTAKGRELENLLVPKVVELQKEMFAQLTSEETEVFSRVLNKLLLQS